MPGPLTAWLRRPEGQALRGSLLDAGLVLLMLVLLWATIAANLVSIRTGAERDAMHDTENLVHAFQEDLGRSIGPIDRMLLLLRTAYAEAPAGFDLGGWTDRARLIGPAAPRFAILDAAGQVIQGGTEAGPDRSISAWPQTSLLPGPGEDKLAISPAVDAGGKQVLLLARPVLSAHGRGVGFVMAIMEPPEVMHRFGSPEAGEDELLIGADGMIRASTRPDGPLSAGHSLAETGLMTRAGASVEGSYISSGALTGEPRILSFGRVTPYGLIVVATAGRDAILAPYRRVRDHYLAGGAMLTALLLVTGALLIGHKRQLLRSRAALNAALENISQGIIMIDSNRRVPVMNRRCVELLGLTPALVASRPTFDDLLRWLAASGEFDGMDEDFRRSMQEGDPPPAPVYEHVRANGTALEVRTQMLPDGGAVCTITDVTERRRAERRIRYLAHHDPLTGLANRAAFDERLATAMAEVEQAGSRLAVLCLDLDGFKPVNDQHGHAIGDRLLMQVAGRIRDALVSGGDVARMGGDEFTIVLTGPDQPARASALAERLIAALAAPYEIDGRIVRIGVSIGIALYPGDGLTADVLLRNADVALYRAKESGRNTFRFFAPDWVGGSVSNNGAPADDTVAAT